MNKNKSIVIIGGGIAGLFAATVLSKLGYSLITIVEKEAEAGGLLRSVTYSNPLGDGKDYVFDYGTHFVLQTANPEIDSILNEFVPSADFTEFTGSLPEGHIFNHQLYQYSGCASAFHLEEEQLNLIQKDLAELAANTNSVNSSETLESFLYSKYGAATTDYIKKPAFKKFTNLEIKNLDISLDSAFSANRIIAYHREETKELKKKEYWDSRVAYTHYEDGTSDIHKYYPKEGGIEKWVQNTVSYLKNNGVTVLTGKEANAIAYDGQTYTVTLSDNQKLQSTYLIWTLPPVILARLLAFNVPSKKPKMRSITCINMITDKEPIVTPYWITVYDPDILSYRITLYDNYQENKGGKYRITVEVLHDSGTQLNKEDTKKTFDEMLRYGVLQKDTNLLWSDSLLIPSGFALGEAGDRDIYIQQVDILESKLKNTYISSRNKVGEHGQISILCNMYDYLKENFS